MPTEDGSGSGSPPRVTLEAELAAMRTQVALLNSENARLLRLLELTRQQARPPGPAQTGIFDVAPGSVHAGSSRAAKVSFFSALFGARAVVLRGGMGAKALTAALGRLEPNPAGPPLLVAATGSYVGEGVDCPMLDTSQQWNRPRPLLEHRRPGSSR